MDDLFARTGQAFLADDLRLACEAYRRLFDALLLDEEVGTFSGPSPAPEMLTADLTEAKARALRALYETSEPDDRVDALATAIGDWRYLGDAVGIHAVADADRAAQLAVACAEALALTEGPPAAARAITELRDRYPRHVAFRAALDAATTKSPLLPSSPRRRR
jgi:hypothetical protein